MMTRSQTSIRWKLTQLMMITSAVALGLTCALLISYQVLTARRDLDRDLTDRADMIGATSTAALQFRDRRAAQEILTALTVDAWIIQGVILDVQGRTFVNWSRAAAYGPVVPAGRVVVERPVIFDKERVGTVVLTGDLRDAYARSRDYAALVLVVLVASIGLTFGLSLRLQRVISAPILHLADQAVRLSREGDFSIRVVKRHNDEIGVLYDRFNEMLQQIEERGAELQRAHDGLEERVRERTRELRFEISERQRTENQLLVAKDAAETASRAKSAFLANMSHELRTPLNAIIGYSEMLREDADALGLTDSKDDLRRIAHSGKHLLALINDILDISKIEAGRMTLQVETFSVSDLVHDVAGTARSLAERSGNALEVGSLDGLGAMTADITRVRQILLNLLSNAAKFTERGVIRLDVTREADERGDRFRFRVEDTGIGISPEQVARLFIEFSQADASTTRRYGGSGLGLAISQQLCRLMGGEITAESRLGEGSVFTAVLPAVVTAPTAAPQPAQALARPPDRVALRPVPVET